MFKSPFFAALGAAVALVALTGAPARAQNTMAPGADSRAIQEQNDRTFGARARPGRASRPDARTPRDRQPAPPTPEETIAAAQAVATGAGVACQVTQANLLGVTGEQVPMYEAACATGPGYILAATTPPVTADCVLLAGQAALDRARDPAAEVGAQCAIPQNTDVLRVLSAYATEAGVACAVDEGASIGKAPNGNLIYEVGCNGLDGYWLEREPTGWKKTECANILTQNATCRYSTAAEQSATLKGRLASNAEAAACDVSQSRYMGANANGAFYEAKCAGGNGLIVRFDNAFAVQQVYPCETAHRIGGGCTLTIVPPAPETPAAAPPPAEQ